MVLVQRDHKVLRVLKGLQGQPEHRALEDHQDQWVRQEHQGQLDQQVGQEQLVNRVWWVLKDHKVLRELQDQQDPLETLVQGVL